MNEERRSQVKKNSYEAEYAEKRNKKE